MRHLLFSVDTSFLLPALWTVQIGGMGWKKGERFEEDKESMIRALIYIAILVAFGVLTAGIAEYILEREEEKERAWNQLHERERLIDEVIEELERRKR